MRNSGSWSLARCNGRDYWLQLVRLERGQTLELFELTLRGESDDAIVCVYVWRVVRAM